MLPLPDSSLTPTLARTACMALLIFYASASHLHAETIAHENSAELNAIAWKIVDPEAAWATVDLDLAMRAAVKGVAFTHEKEGAILDTLARVHFLKGDLEKAIEVETKAVEVSKDKMKESLEKTLAEYKAKRAQ